MDEYLEAMDEDMSKAHAAVQEELNRIRTGRASPKLIDGIAIEVTSYGTSMPLNQLATVQAPDGRLLVVTPWDKTTVADIQRGIMAAGLGLNPVTDGQILRVPVPPLTQERRQDLVRTVRKIGEDGKVRVRHVRREYNDTFKSEERDGEISEDELRRLLGRVQEATDQGVNNIDALVAAKELEVLEV